MKQKKSLVKILRQIIKKELKITVQLNSKLLDYEEWDSIGNFNILLACEDKFNKKFTANEFSKLKTFKEILTVVKKKIKK